MCVRVCRVCAESIIIMLSLIDCPRYDVRKAKHIPVDCIQYMAGLNSHILTPSRLHECSMMGTFLLMLAMIGVPAVQALPDTVDAIALYRNALCGARRHLCLMCG